MKYIKKFENSEEKLYWKVSTAPDMYKKSLEYIGVPDNNLLYDLGLTDKGKYIFIANSYGWTWCRIKSKKWLKDNGYKYMFEVDDDVLNANKYGI